MGIESANDSKAFNQGSDARIAGHGLDWNPYFRMENAHLKYYWQAGWQDVDKYWGWRNAYAKPLPAVMK